jgi:arylsulfatase A-like enzyme
MKNVILITVDGLRYDHSQVIKDGIVEILGPGLDFDNAHSTGPSSSMSYVGFLCSKFPTFPDEINTILKANVSRKRTLLYGILKDNGYDTYAISNSLFNRYFGYDKSLDLMIDKSNKTSKKIINAASKLMNFNILPYYDAQDITELVRGIYKEKINNNKYFMHINYMDAHSPANINNGYISKNYSKKEVRCNNLGVDEITAIREIFDTAKNTSKDLPDEINYTLTTYQKLYYYETLYLAEHIKIMLKHLLDKVSTDTVIILHSDHGEYLSFEGNLLGHGLPIKHKEEAINVFYDSLIHVPLTFWGLGEKKERKVVSLVDLSPTILDILGIDIPSEWYGDSMLSNNDKPAISEDIRHGYSCYSVRTNDFVFVYNEQTKQEYLFKRSPEDKKDISSERPGEVVQMHKRLEAHKKKIKVCSREYLIKGIDKLMTGVK